ncbi:MAG: flippase-like domain-containing protein [Proteobacteria bacterium]|nr:flippase-like domain-containing protein [Pseudomonadota bacterium]
MHKGPAKKKGASIKRLFLIFCAITIFIIGLVIAKTAGPETWHAIREMNSSYLLLALILGAAMISLNAVIIKVLAAAAETRIGFLYAVETVLSYWFLSSISPTVTGGEPLMIYMLTKKGVPFGKALTIALVRGFLVLLVIAVAAPSIIYFRGDLIENVYLRKFFYSIAAVISLAVVFLAYAFHNPRKIERLIRRVRLRAAKWKILSRYAETIEKKMDTWIDDFVACLKSFLKYRRKTILAVVALTLLSMAANYLIAYAILAGLGFMISPLVVVMIQFVLYFFLYFTPTPGGSGVAEGGSYIMFAAYVPTHLLGVFIVLWRFFTTYLWMVLGGAFITRSIGLNIVEKIPSSMLSETAHHPVR